MSQLSFFAQGFTLRFLGMTTTILEVSSRGPAIGAVPVGCVGQISKCTIL